MSGNELALTISGSILGLFVLACVAIVLSRMNELDNRCRCNGECNQGRDCPARRK